MACEGREPDISPNDPGYAWRISGLGMEFFGSIAGMGFVGWLIDGWAGTGPRWLMIGLIVGMIGGGANLYRRAVALNRRAGEKSPSSRSLPRASDLTTKGNESSAPTQSEQPKPCRGAFDESGGTGSRSGLDDWFERTPAEPGDDEPELPTPADFDKF